jgi:hypothetical protein
MLNLRCEKIYSINYYNTKYHRSVYVRIHGGQFKNELYSLYFVYSVNADARALIDNFVAGRNCYQITSTSQIFST